MDHHGFYPDISSSFSSIISQQEPSNSQQNSFPDNNLTTINNIKYQQQTNLTGSLPSQININNLNNNFVFSDDGLFDSTATTSSSSACTNNNLGDTSQKNICYVRKMEPSGTGGDSITYNINNINTNIVNNINNSTNITNGTSDFFSNPYPISKNGESIINFSNTNINTSMSTNSNPANPTSSYYYQGSSQVQNTFDTTQQPSNSTQQTSQSQSSNFVDPNIGKNMGGSGTTYHPHHQSSNNVITQNPAYIPNSLTPLNADLSTSYNEFSDPIAKPIINNFEVKNPLKYPPAPAPGGSRSVYYNPAQSFAPLPHHIQPTFPPAPTQSTPNKVNQNYENFPHVARNILPPPPHHYTSHPYSHHQINENLPMNSCSRIPSYPNPGLQPPYSHMPPNPYMYPNGYHNGNIPMPNYHRSLSHQSTTSTGYPPLVKNYSRSNSHGPGTSENNTYPLQPTSYPLQKPNEFDHNNPYPYNYEDGHHLSSCAKVPNPSPTSRSKPTETFNSNPYGDNYSMQYSHHPRNINYQQQPLPKALNPGLAYPHSYDYQGYHGVNHSCSVIKTNEYAKNKAAPYPSPTKVNPAHSTKQFKTYDHFEQPSPQSKQADKGRYTIDLEEQITGSRIPKMRDNGYGYPMNPYIYETPKYHPYFPYVPRHSIPMDKGTSNAGNLREFLSSWNEIDEDEEANPNHRQAANIGILEDKLLANECSITREYNPMFGQRLHDSVIVANNVVVNGNLPDVVADTGKLKSMHENSWNSDLHNSEKLYILEQIEVPASELNKYKHLNVIHKLPENVVPISVENSLKFIEEIESNREKYYKNDLDTEVVFDAHDEDQRLNNQSAKNDKVKISEKTNMKSNDGKNIPNDNENIPVLKSVKKRLQKEISEKSLPIRKKAIKMKIEKMPKDHRKLRITKKYRKYALNPRPSSTAKTLKSICVDFLNTSEYRNYARQCFSIKQNSCKKEFLKDIKKKFNFDNTRKSVIPLNNKTNCSVRINSLKDICNKVIVDNSIDSMEYDDDEYNYPPYSAPIDITQTDEEDENDDVFENPKTPTIEKVEDEPNSDESNSNKSEEKSEPMEQFPEKSENTVEEGTPKQQEEEQVQNGSVKESEIQEETNKSSENTKIIEETETVSVAKTDSSNSSPIEIIIIKTDSDSSQSSPSKSSVKSSGTSGTSLSDSGSDSESSTSSSSSESESSSDSDSDESDSSDSEPEEDEKKYLPKKNIQQFFPEPPATTVKSECDSTIEPKIEEGSEKIVIHDVEILEPIKVEEVKTLRELCKMKLAEAGVNVIEEPIEPLSLRQICENFIYSHRQYFIIEDITTVPKLQDLCKNVLSETNIFINIDDPDNICIINDVDSNGFINNEEFSEGADDPVYVLNGGPESIAELFSSDENMDLIDKIQSSEILQKIQSGTNLDIEDELFKAIDEMHRDTSVCINNNSTEVSNKNFLQADEGDFFDADKVLVDPSASLLSFTSTDDFNIQYEEVVPVNDIIYKNEKIYETLRFKYLNRINYKFDFMFVKRIFKKYLCYQRYVRYKNLTLLKKNLKFIRRKPKKNILKQLKHCDNLTEIINSENQICRTTCSSYNNKPIVNSNIDNNDENQDSTNFESQLLAKEIQIDENQVKTEKTIDRERKETKEDGKDMKSEGKLKSLKQKEKKTEVKTEDPENKTIKLDEEEVKKEEILKPVEKIEKTDEDEVKPEKAEQQSCVNVQASTKPSVPENPLSDAKIKFEEKQLQLIEKQRRDFQRKFEKFRLQHEMAQKKAEEDARLAESAIKIETRSKHAVKKETDSKHVVRKETDKKIVSTFDEAILSEEPKWPRPPATLEKPQRETRKKIETYRTRQDCPAQNIRSSRKPVEENKTTESRFESRAARISTRRNSLRIQERLHIKEIEVKKDIRNPPEPPPEKPTRQSARIMGRRDSLKTYEIPRIFDDKKSNYDRNIKRRNSFQKEIKIEPIKPEIIKQRRKSMIPYDYHIKVESPKAPIPAIRSETSPKPLFADSRSKEILKKVSSPKEPEFRPEPRRIMKRRDSLPVHCIKDYGERSYHRDQRGGGGRHYKSYTNHRDQTPRQYRGDSQKKQEISREQLDTQRKIESAKEKVRTAQRELQELTQTHLTTIEKTPEIKMIQIETEQQIKETVQKIQETQQIIIETKLKIQEIQQKQQKELKMKFLQDEQRKKQEETLLKFRCENFPKAEEPKPLIIDLVEEDVEKKKEEKLEQTNQQVEQNNANATIVENSGELEDCATDKIAITLPEKNTDDLKTNNHNHRHHHASQSSRMKKRKMSFDESLRNINKIYSKISSMSITGENQNPKEESPKSHKHHNHHHHRSHSHRHSRNKSPPSDERHGINGNIECNNNYHNGSHTNFFGHRKDGARRLIIPSYKIYDKNLDIKLKRSPYVILQRSGSVENLAKSYDFKDKVQ